MLGSALRTKLGDNYSVVGLMAKHTGVTCASGQIEVFSALPNSLEYLADDNKPVWRREELNSLSSISLGETTNGSSPLKEGYLALSAPRSTQFDYAAIIQTSNAMKAV